MLQNTTKAHIFREYDIRGIFEADLDEPLVTALGYALGEHIKMANLPPQVHIGYDARTHSPTLFTWLALGLYAAGIEVFSLGLIPTPVAYFATFNEIDSVFCKNSIMITGSHNPPQYNGFKITLNQAPFYGEDIKKLGLDLTKILSQSLQYPNECHFSILNAKKSYIDFLTHHFASLKDFPYQIAIDCGNGVASVGIKEVLENLHIPYTPLFFEPNGAFPNHHPDPSVESNLTALKSTMQEQHIHIGIAFDGDADRLALLTDSHNYKGDELAILFAQDMHRHRINPIVIGEVKCSQTMYDEINKIGKAIMYKTGHSNLKVKLKELNAHLAAEMSGHIFFNDKYFGYDDAIYSSLRALELFLFYTPNELESAISSLPRTFSTDEESIASTESHKFAMIDALNKALQNPPKDFPPIREIITIDGLRIVFDNGWGLVRASNTTPTLVTRFEANSKDLCEFYKFHILSLLQSCADAFN